MPVYYDPYDIGIVADPYPTYAALRDEAPLYHNERYDFWALSRHADVEVGALLPDGEVRVACAPALAERAIANLVQNAVEHHRGAGNVALLLTATEDRFELCVEDDGPGLPPEVRASLEAESLLTDEARPRGPGLGMLITAEIARRAGWTLTYEALEPTGVRARLTGQLERR